MEITQNNYQKYFENLETEIQNMQNLDCELARDLIERLKLELSSKRKGAVELMEENSILKIGVVGQVKAGKSSFLNSLFFDGENVLPRASTPMTAGLTIIEYGEQNQFTVEYYNTSEWQTFVDQSKHYDDTVESYKLQFPEQPHDEIIKQVNSIVGMEIQTAKELVSNFDKNKDLSVKNKIKDKSVIDPPQPFSDHSDLQGILEKYVGADGQYTSIVKCLRIQLNNDRIKGVQIVDTPGVNDPVVSREQRTREFLRSCHGVFFLSFSSHFFDSTDVEFLVDRIGSQGIGEVVLIASKFDSALQDIGKKYPDDLSNAIVALQADLKKQFLNNINSVSSKVKMPVLDFSSGIGFSISKKPSSRWDGVERHVVERMKVYYPSFFATEDDVREIFYNLSQMDTIEKEYKNGIFLNRKEEIIKEKINSYFSNISDSAKKIAQEGKLVLGNKRRELDSTDKKDLETKRDVVLKTIDSIDRCLDTVGGRVQQQGESSLSDCVNELRVVPPSVSCKSITKTFCRTSTFWGRDKYFDCTYDAVDINKIVENIINIIQKNAKTVSSLWKKTAERLKKIVKDTIDDKLKEAEANDSTHTFSADSLRDILYVVLDGMESRIEEGDLISNMEELAYSKMQGTDDLGYVQKCFDGEDSEGRSHVRDLADKCRRKARLKVSDIIDSYNKQVKQVLSSEKERIVGVIVEKKSSFIKRAKDDSDNYLSQLKSALEDKEKNLRILDGVIDSLTSFISKL